MTSLIGGRRSEGGEDSVRSTGNYIFDKHNTTVLVNDRSARSFVEKPALPFSALEIALTPEIRKIFKYLSSCLHDVKVGGHPAGGSAEAFAKSTAPFEHGRPLGLEGMGVSFVKVMRRRLHIRIILSRLGCFTSRTRTRSAAIPAWSCWLSTPERAV